MKKALSLLLLLGAVLLSTGRSAEVLNSSVATEPVKPSQPDPPPARRAISPAAETLAKLRPRNPISFPTDTIVRNAELPVAEELTRYRFMDGFRAIAERSNKKTSIKWLQTKEDTMTAELELRRLSLTIVADSSMLQVKQIIGEPAYARKIVQDKNGDYPWSINYRTNGTAWIFSPHPPRKIAGNVGDRFSILYMWFDETKTLKEAHWRNADID